MELLLQMEKRLLRGRGLIASDRVRDATLTLDPATEAHVEFLTLRCSSSWIPGTASRRSRRPVPIRIASSLNVVAARAWWVSSADFKDAAICRLWQRPFAD